MKNHKIAAMVITLGLMLSFLSSCVVVVRDHPHRHWHRGPRFHERVIVR